VSTHIIIAGAGIGGLGAALALCQIGAKVTVLEQSDAFGEVGAGVQISPNAFKVLSDWGLGEALKNISNFPEKLQVRSAASNKLLGQLTLGTTAQARYGFPFATIRRADLHALLFNTVRQQPNVELHLNAKVGDITEKNQQVTVKTEANKNFTADAMIGADGLWSRIREHVLRDESPNSQPRATGHTAWRAMLPMADVPTELQNDQVTAWLAPDSHTIAYPVQQGRALNIVYCCENKSKNDNFDEKNNINGNKPAYLLPKLLSNVLHKTLHKVLQTTFQTATDKNAWTRWDLFDSPPLTSSAQMFNPAHPQIALLGDAAHPMLPYLAQGAGMALEDAQALALSIQQNPADLPSALQLYAQTRWQRNAKVQARAARNGQIFHAKPPVSWARDVAMGLWGEKIMDMPWLYSEQ
jgi:salicylate hydroxylase